MMEDVWFVDCWRPRLYRRVILYRAHSQLWFPDAAEVAAASRRVGAPVFFIFRGRRRPATDPLQLFLAGVFAGDELEFLVIAPPDPVRMTALDRILGRLTVEPRLSEVR